MELYRLSGAGNDFLAQAMAEGAPLDPPSAERIAAWCRRGLSLGADGFFTLERIDGGARMSHWNADGGRSALCLNGSRCAVQLACHLGWHQDGRLTLETGAGALDAHRLDARRVSLALPPLLGAPEPTPLVVEGMEHAGWSVLVGVPHFVLLWPESLAAVPMARLGPALRAHPALGPDGANASFVRFLAPNRFEIRTYERGVEAETLACGSGVVAAAVVGVAMGELRPPIKALTAGGCELVLEGRVEADRLLDARLAGDARLVARVTVEPGADAVEPAAKWSV